MIGMLLYDDVEVLDVCGPYEVLTTASRVAARSGAGRPAPFDVVLLAAEAGEVRTRPGMRLGVDVPLDEAPALDLLLVPGGVTDAVERDERVVGWLRRRPAPLAASVCTGAFLLAEAGLVVDERVTTHWEDVAELRRRHPRLDVVDDVRWVRDGDTWTSAGISAGTDLAPCTWSRRTPGARSPRRPRGRWTTGGWRTTRSSAEPGPRYLR